MSRPLLTATEVAERLRTTDMVIIRACRAGKIRATKPNQSWLISEDALADYLDEHSNTKDVA